MILKFKPHDCIFYTYDGFWMVAKIVKILHENEGSIYGVMFKYHVIEKGLDSNTKRWWMLEDESAFTYQSPMYNNAKVIKDASKSTILAMVL